MRTCKCRHSGHGRALQGAGALVHVFAPEAVDEGAGDGDEEGEAQLGVIVRGDAQVEAAGLLGVQAAAAGHLRLCCGGELRGQVAGDGHVIPEVHEGCAHDHLHNDMFRDHLAAFSCISSPGSLRVGSISESRQESHVAHVRLGYLGALVIAEAQPELCLASGGVLPAHACVASHAAQGGYQLGLLGQLQPVLHLASHSDWTLLAEKPPQYKAQLFI